MNLLNSLVDKVILSCLVSSALAAPSTLAQNSDPLLQDERNHRAEHQSQLHIEKEQRQMHDRLAKEDDRALHKDLKEGNSAAAHEEAIKISQQDQYLHKDKSEIQHEKHYVKKDKHEIKQNLKKH